MTITDTLAMEAPDSIVQFGHLLVCISLLERQSVAVMVSTTRLAANNDFEVCDSILKIGRPLSRPLSRNEVE